MESQKKKSKLNFLELWILLGNGTEMGRTCPSDAKLHMAKLAWETYPVGRRLLEQPRLRWRNNRKNDLGSLGIIYDSQMMMDRNN